MLADLRNSKGRRELSAAWMENLFIGVNHEYIESYVFTLYVGVLRHVTRYSNVTSSFIPQPTLPEEATVTHRLVISFFAVALWPSAGHGLLILEVFLDHTRRRIAVGRTPLDEWSARRRDLYLTIHNTHNRQTLMPPVGFEPMISAGERPQTYALDSAATRTGHRIVIPLLNAAFRGSIPAQIMFLYHLWLCSVKLQPTMQFSCTVSSSTDTSIITL